MKSTIVLQEFVPDICMGLSPGQAFFNWGAMLSHFHCITQHIAVNSIWTNGMCSMPGWVRLVLGHDFNSWGMETCRGSIPPPWRLMLIKVTKNDATCCNVLNRTSSDKPVIAQLVEHLTVDSCSNQMVPGSIPGDRISWRYCPTNKHEASIRMLGIFDRHSFSRHVHCFSCIIHQKFQADACQGNDIPPIEKGSCAGGTSR